MRREGKQRVKEVQKVVEHKEDSENLNMGEQVGWGLGTGYTIQGQKVVQHEA